MSVQLGAHVIPNDLAVRGKYTFQRQKQRPNGAGTLINYGEQAATWVWPYLSSTDYAWLVTYCGETLFVLWDDANTEQTFSAGVMTRPVAERVDGDLYYNVKVEFHCLTPLL